MGAWAVPACLGVQEGWWRQEHARLWRASSVLQRHVDAIAKVLRGKCPVLSHSQSLLVQAGGGEG